VHDQKYRFSSAADGISLQGYAWLPKQPPIAAVAIAHGAAEHAGRYERFARALNAAGFATYALDHRGHGASIGPKGLGDLGAGGWNALVDDLAQLIAQARGHHPDLPLALFAHSMGSFAAQQLCFDRSALIDALVLSGSTAWELPREGTLRPRFEPNLAFEPARTPYDWLSRDPNEVDKYVADPLCGFEMQSGRSSGSWIDWKRVNDPIGPRGIRSDLPVLLVAGEEDPLNRKLEGLNLLQQRWHDAGVARIDTRYYQGGRHEMLNEINRDAVTDDVVTWLQEALRI
jgi:alpha-beta hydrolase superfamily lysophospholipase